MPDTQTKPIAFSAPLAILAGGFGALVWALVRFWGANPEYVDRFLILAAAAWVGWQVRPKLLALAPRPARVGYVPLLIGAAAFPVGWFLVAQVGPKPVVLWWLTMSWVVATAGFVLIAGGWAHLRLLAFPLAFLLFALPIPNRILVPLQFALQSATTAAAAAALPILGVPVERSGFVLSLPNGDLGVAEACSGVRSVTALTAIAAFVAWWRGFGFLRGAALVGLSVPVIAGVNAVRVIISGLLQEYVGAEYLRGHWHEALGVAMVLFGLALIVGLAGLLSVRGNAASREGGETASPPATTSSHRLPDGRGSSRFAFLLLTCSLVVTVAAHFLGAGAEQELVAAAPIDQIPQSLGSWKGADRPVPDEVRDMLTADAIIHRDYRDLGYEVTVWVIYWSSRNMVKGYHHPDVCWRNRGFRQESRDLVPIAAGGGTIPVTVREFARAPESRATRQLILYWTQEGKRIWSEEDERRVQAAGDSHDWLGERLFRREPPAATGRLVVLIGTLVWDDGKTIRAQTLDFAARLAEELYRACPWAAPPGE
jgi:EpsI family protein